MVWAKETSFNWDRKATLLKAINRSELKQLNGREQAEYIIDAMRYQYNGYWFLSAGEPTEFFAYHTNVEDYFAEFYYAQKQWRVGKSCN